MVVHFTQQQQEMSKLVEYPSSDDDDYPINNNPKRVKVDAAPVVGVDYTFSRLSSISDRELSRNMPLKDLDKPLQGILLYTCIGLYIVI